MLGVGIRHRISSRLQTSVAFKMLNGKVFLDTCLSWDTDVAHKRGFLRLPITQEKFETYRKSNFPDNITAQKTFYLAR